jgi:hypothetical protein
MLNTKKLLYILPDLTYLAELLPNKKEHEYSIQSFRQINGEFLDDNDFISNNIQKLFTKIDKEEYHLILPDFLFTNTIVSVKEDSESAALTHVRKKLLPTLNLSEDTHEIETTVLTSFKGSSKVQISAIEKNILDPIREASKQSKVKISAISPLSWAIKSIVSLEPSITVLQIGTNLYSAQHYIGIDQTNGFPVEELGSIIETIKTLKGAEPSIQTIYLASSSLIEEKLKKDLGGTLPIQQLATYKEDDSKIPSYVKYIIESCMKTISIKDFPVPKFNLGKSSKTKEIDKPEKTKNSEEEKVDNNKTAPTDLPEPSKVPEVVSVAEIKETPNMPKKEEKIEEKVNVEIIEAVDEKPKKEEPKEELLELEIKEEKPEAKDSKPEDVEKKEETTDKDKEINLSQFAGKEDDAVEDIKVETKDKVKSEDKEAAPEEKVDSLDHDKIIQPKKIIKNSSGVNNMLKMVFITLAVFFITIAIGIGVGLGLLKMSDKNPKEDVNPVVVTETEATPEPTPTPEPEVEINKEELSILVVNATTTAGYAGKIKTLLIADGIEDIKAGNAEGEYDEGTDYILMTKENDSLTKMLEEATDLNLEFSSDVEVEDNSDDYDAVIVLAK